MLNLAGGIFVPILIKKLCDLVEKPIKKNLENITFSSKMKTNH